MLKLSGSEDGSSSSGRQTLHALRTMHDSAPEQVAALVSSGKKITRKNIAKSAENFVITKKSSRNGIGAEKRSGKTAEKFCHDKKIEPEAVPTKPENLVMTKKVEPPAAQNYIVVEHNGREAVITNNKFFIRYADNGKTVEVESAEVTVK